MNTQGETPRGRVPQPRVWLAGGGSTPLPSRAEVDQLVLTDLQHFWFPDPDVAEGGPGWSTSDGRHHATCAELHARHDLIEVPQQASLPHQATVSATGQRR